MTQLPLGFSNSAVNLNMGSQNVEIGERALVDSGSLSKARGVALGCGLLLLLGRHFPLLDGSSTMDIRPTSPLGSGPFSGEQRPVFWADVVEL